MENEKIYVVVPVYKVEAYLERCVESILNQTYDNYELILVDDGSPDNCPAICDQYAAKYDHITVIHQENGGLSAARNAGIEYALKHGDKENNWINFIDSDDFVHPRYLEYLYRAAKETGTDISCCGFVRTEATEISSVDIGGMKYVNLPPEELYIKNTTNADSAWGKLYRLFLFRDTRYPVGKIFEDTFTTYKILFQYSNIPVVWTKLYYWYINSESITLSEWTPARIDELDPIEEQLDYFAQNGYEKAYRSAVQVLFRKSILHCATVHGLSPKYDYMLKEMTLRQRNAFNLYEKEYGLRNAITFWSEIRILRPAKRLLRNKSVFTFLKRKINQMILRK